ncbi:MAG: LemA family protein [Nitriliruptoraceae bacterium]
METAALWLLGTLLFLALVVVVLYNRLVRAKVKVRQAWAQVAVQQQRRHDLIPNVVAAARGSAAHERGLLDAVTAARTRALAATSHLDQDAAEQELTALLGQLLVLTEAQPDLQADGSFRQLQEELRDTEDRLAFARGFANDRVARYRTLTDTFPSSILAGLFRFPREEMFARASERVALAPDVQLGGR